MARQAGVPSKRRGVAEAEEAAEVVEKALPQDLYGSTFYRTVKSLRDSNWPDLVLAWVKIAMNIGVQVFIIFTVHFHINVDFRASFRPAAGLRAWTDRLEEVLPYHRLEDLNTSAPELDRSLEMDGDIIDFCDGLPVGWILHISWFLWTVASMQEIISTYETAKCILLVPLVDYGTQALEEGSAVIKGLSKTLKGLFLVALMLPKFIISLLLWWCGVEFLGYGTDTGGVILRIMSLKFVLTLDELIFGAFASREYKGELKKAKILSEKHVVPIWIAEFMRAFVALILCVACELYFRDIMELRRACHSCAHSCNALCSNAWDFCSTDPCSTSWMPLFFGC